MATSKPKLQGYIDQQLFDQFEIEQRQWGLTQSQALERILAERYGRVHDEDRQRYSPQLSLHSLDKSLLNLEELVSKLSDRLLTLEQKVFGESLHVTSGPTSELLVADESLQIVSNLDSSDSLDITNGPTGESLTNP